MSDAPWSHLNNGLFVQRTSDGGVAFQIRSLPNSETVWSTKTDAFGWASVVAFVSRRGESAASHRDALLYHELDLTKCSHGRDDPNTCTACTHDLVMADPTARAAYFESRCERLEAERKAERDQKTATMRKADEWRERFEKLSSTAGSVLRHVRFDHQSLCQKNVDRECGTCDCGADAANALHTLLRSED